METTMAALKPATSQQRISIDLPTQLVEGLNELATTWGVSRAWVIRAALTDYLAAEQKEDD